MNLQNLRENYPKLIAYMTENDYAESYVSKLRSEIMRIIDKAENEGWNSYADVYRDYAAKTDSPQNLRMKRTYLGIIEHFDIRGYYPDGVRRHEITERGKYHLLNQEFKDVIDYYSVAERKRGKKESTIRGEAHNAACFMFELQQTGCKSPGQVMEKDVLSFFLTPEGKLYRGHSYKKNIAAVFKACVPQDPETFGRILAYLPPLREKRKNIQYLKPEETDRLRHLFADKDAPISLRDRAIGILAMHTGLRSCDIAGLTSDAIDWEKDCLYINQQKTEVPIELPLTATVGNAIYDYLNNERQASGTDYVFLSKSRPYGRLRDRSVGNIAGKIMDAANIRMAPGDRRGFHIFRHHLATELLGNDVPQPVISRVVGHTSPDSLEAYLSADFKHLKECALSIERYPMSKGVLCYA